MTTALCRLGWIACVVYSTIPSFWLLVHPFAEYWRTRRRSSYLALLPAWLALWAIVAAISGCWRHIAMYATPFAWIPAGILFAIGAWLYFQSFRHFTAQQLGGTPEILAGNPQQKLVTVGIRARIRHPVYLAHLCEMLAWSMGTGLVVCYALLAFALITGSVMIHLEDGELERRFGAQYAEYKKRVPAVLPRL